MKILVIIVSYNFERWMDRCLGSLHLSEQPADVMVIDNASQDHTVQLIREHYPEVRLIQSPENLGFGRANNLGMKVALAEGYDYVFLLNQDAWIDRNTLGTLASLCASHPQYGILSPTHLTGSGNRLEHGFACYARLNSLEELTSVPCTAQTPPVDLPFVNAAFWMIPVSVLRRVGGFCPLFYHYGEDVDYVNRLRRHGYRAGYTPAVFGCHDREHRQTDHKTWLRSERIYLLTEYANINRSFPRAFAYSVLASLKKSAQSFWTKKDARTGLSYIRIACQLLGCTGKVLRYRRINLQPETPHYIATES